ncbi:helicase associated domain-containing protein [Streptomyces sp. SD15]
MNAELGDYCSPKHVETIVMDGVGEDQEQRDIKLGAWIGNRRSRALTLSPERMEQLSSIGMRWTSPRCRGPPPPGAVGRGGG